jgi:hypothetical protein
VQKPWNLSRRNLLKASLAAPALWLPSREIIEPAHARVLRGSGIALSPPSPAAAVGYNRLAFYDDFLSLSTIDVNNTGNAGFNWYVDFTNGRNYANGDPFPPMTSADMSVSNSILTLQNSPGNTGFQGICSAKFNNDGTLKHGNVFTNGAFFQYSFRYDESLAPGLAGATSWPSVASGTFSCFVNGVFPDTELDFYEGPPCSPINSCQGNNFAPTAHTNKQFNFNYRLGPNLDTINGGLNVNGGSQTNGQNWNNMQTMGTLWVPMAQNSGTGYTRRFLFQGSSWVELPLINVHYTATGPATFPNGGNSINGTNSNGIFSTLDSQLNPLAIYGALGWPILVDFVAVWTL